MVASLKISLDQLGWQDLEFFGEHFGYFAVLFEEIRHAQDAAATELRLGGPLKLNANHEHEKAETVVRKGSSLQAYYDRQIQSGSDREKAAEPIVEFAGKLGGIIEQMRFYISQAEAASRQSNQAASDRFYHLAYASFLFYILVQRLYEIDVVHSQSPMYRVSATLFIDSLAAALGLRPPQSGVFKEVQTKMMNTLEQSAPTIEKKAQNALALAEKIYAQNFLTDEERIPSRVETASPEDLSTKTNFAEPAEDWDNDLRLFLAREGFGEKAHKDITANDLLIFRRFKGEGLKRMIDLMARALGITIQPETMDRLMAGLTRDWVQPSGSRPFPPQIMEPLHNLQYAENEAEFRSKLEILRQAIQRFLSGKIPKEEYWHRSIARLVEPEEFTPEQREMLKRVANRVFIAFGLTDDVLKEKLISVTRPSSLGSLFQRVKEIAPTMGFSLEQSFTLLTSRLFARIYFDFITNGVLKSGDFLFESSQMGGVALIGISVLDLRTRLASKASLGSGAAHEYTHVALNLIQSNLLIQGSDSVRNVLEDWIANAVESIMGGWLAQEVGENPNQWHGSLGFGETVSLWAYQEGRRIAKNETSDHWAQRIEELKFPEEELRYGQGTVLGGIAREIGEMIASQPGNEGRYNPFELSLAFVARFARETHHPSLAELAPISEQFLQEHGVSGRAETRALIDVRTNAEVELAKNNLKLNPNQKSWIQSEIKNSIDATDSRLFLVRGRGLPSVRGITIGARGYKQPKNWLDWLVQLFLQLLGKRELEDEIGIEWNRVVLRLEVNQFQSPILENEEGLRSKIRELISQIPDLIRRKSLVTQEEIEEHLASLASRQGLNLATPQEMTDIENTINVEFSRGRKAYYERFAQRLHELNLNQTFELPGPVSIDRKKLFEMGLVKQMVNGKPIFYVLRQGTKKQVALTIAGFQTQRNVRDPQKERFVSALAEATQIANVARVRALEQNEAEELIHQGISIDLTHLSNYYLQAILTEKNLESMAETEGKPVPPIQNVTDASRRAFIFNILIRKLDAHLANFGYPGEQSIPVSLDNDAVFPSLQFLLPLPIENLTGDFFKRSSDDEFNLFLNHYPVHAIFQPYYVMTHDERFNPNTWFQRRDQMLAQGFEQLKIRRPDLVQAAGVFAERVTSITNTQMSELIRSQNVGLGLIHSDLFIDEGRGNQEAFRQAVKQALAPIIQEFKKISPDVIEQAVRQAGYSEDQVKIFVALVRQNQEMLGQNTE